MHLMLNIMKPGKKHSGNLLKTGLLDKFTEGISPGLTPRGTKLGAI
jgi:hypothetical protein